MKHLRAIVRAFAFCLVTGLLYALFVAGSLSVIPFNQGARRWRSFIFRTWAKMIAAVLGMKLTVQGRPPVAPFFLVSNHLSYVDVIVFAALLDCVFIAKQDVAGWPVFGRLCRSFKTIFVNRERPRDAAHVNALIAQTIADHFFPKAPVRLARACCRSKLRCWKRRHKPSSRSPTLR
jgi:1-acyl-sn-glycerol-3-phosphate acyltransferase